MRDLTHLLTALAVLLLAQGIAVAQPPTAPMPHPTLDELVKVYQRLGLPLPPPNAELVRVKGWPESGGLFGGRFPAQPDRLGFRIPSEKPGDESSYLVGTNQESATTVEPVKPGLEALRDIHPTYSSELLALAVQCRVRGWNEMASALYAHARRGMEDTPSTELVVPTLGVGSHGEFLPGCPVTGELRRAAHEHWKEAVTSRSVDRTKLLEYLELADIDRSLIRDLELTLAPRKSKPGSAEALIDNLTEYWSPTQWKAGYFDTEKESNEAAYWKLVELGFDAVPALLAHLDDPRFTRDFAEYRTPPRIRPFGGDPFPRARFHLRVGHLCGWILDDLADGAIAGRGGRESMADPGKARVWWEKTRVLGEEKWLAERAFAPNYPSRDSWDVANQVILRVLAVKYPDRLAEVYRSRLRDRPWLPPDALARAVGESKLPRNRKVALLEDGASHASLSHRLAALRTLADLDQPTFRRHLIKTLAWLPRDIEGHDYATCPEQELAALTLRTDDPKCWRALTATTRRVSVGLRFQFLEQITEGWDWGSPAGLPAPIRTECLRYLVEFLDDRSDRREPARGKDYGLWGSPWDSSNQQIRDFVAKRLAALYGIDIAFGLAAVPTVQLLTRHTGFDLCAELEKREFPRLFLRAVVRELAERELAAGK